MAATEAPNPAAINEVLVRYGVENVCWTGARGVRAGWNEVLEEQSADDPTFKTVADGYLAFREVYQSWGDAQALKVTYLSK